MTVASSSAPSLSSDFQPNLPERLLLQLIVKARLR
jgi:hypothetical protein